MSSFKETPISLLLSAFQKMDTRTLCRMRQTCRLADDLAEMYRNRIQTRCKTSDARSLLLCNDGGSEGEKYPEDFEVVILTDRFTKPCPNYVKDAMHFNRLHGEYVHVNEKTESNIDEVYKQLSCVFFDAVFCEGDFIDTEAETEPDMPWVDKSIELLEKLQLSVNYLAVKYVSDSKLLDILDIVEFENIAISGFYYVNYEHWPIQHCKDIDVRFVYEEYWEDLLPAVLNSETACILFDEKMDLANKMQEMIYNLLDFGNLKQLTIGADDFHHDQPLIYGTSLLGDLPIFGGDDYFDDVGDNRTVTELNRVTTYTCKNGRRAILVYVEILDQKCKNKQVTIHFDKDSREDLIEVVFHTIFAHTPYDLSAIYDYLMTSRDITDQFICQILYHTYNCHFPVVVAAGEEEDDGGVIENNVE